MNDDIELTCPSCNWRVIGDKVYEWATCPHCSTDFKIEDAVEWAGESDGKPDDPPESPQDSTLPDEEWIASLPVELRGVGRRFGRALLAFTIQTGNYNGGLQILLKRVRGNNELMQALKFLTSASNDIFLAYVNEKGWSSELLSEVKQDTERAMLLANSGPEAKTGGGIIIAH